MNGSTYLALPGASLTSLMANLPQLLYDDSPSVIYLDSYDYARHRGRFLTERGNTKIQALGMAFEELRRRGRLRTINYGEYYPQWIQERNAEQCQALLDAASDTAVQHAAVQAGNGYLDYCLGSYQDTLRAGLDDGSPFTNRRESVAHQRKKMERGGGDPETWHKRIFSQYLTALAVRHYVNRDRDVHIDGIIGQGETKGIDALLRSSDIDMSDFGSPGYPTDHIGRVNTKRSAALNNRLDMVGTLAREITGTQHHDCFLLGPRLAFPQLSEIFPEAWHSLQSDYDMSELVSETHEILSHLETADEDNRSVAAIEAQADWLAEESDLSSTDTQDLVDQVDSAVSLSNHSRELREFVAEGRSPAAIYLAASIKQDPQYRYNEDSIFSRVQFLKSRLEPMAISNSEIDYFKDRGNFRRGESGKDWHQNSIFHR